MNYVIFVHLLEAEGDFVEREAAEILRILTRACSAYSIHGALIHDIEDDVNLTIVVVHGNAIYQFIAVEICVHPGLHHDFFYVFLLQVLQNFKREFLFVRSALDFIDRRLAALTELLFV